MIQAIQEQDWKEILEIQSDAYYEIIPESISVLKSKWSLSPNTCFIYKENNKVLAYLLAHPWQENSAPDLNEELKEIKNSDGIFIHDLAIRKIEHQKGIGTKLYLHLENYAKQKQIRFFSLISIQNSKAFWEQKGFYPVTISKDLESYGKDAIYMKQILFNGIE